MHIVFLILHNDAFIIYMFLNQNVNNKIGYNYFFPKKEQKHSLNLYAKILIHQCYKEKTQGCRQ